MDHPSQVEFSLDQWFQIWR